MPKVPVAPRPTIKVTQDIIDKATRADSGHCMIADAVRASVPGASHVAVDLQSIRWTDPKRGLRYAYLTPRLGQLKLLQFDQGEENIKPFKLMLRDAIVTKSRRWSTEGNEGNAVPDKATLVEMPRSGRPNGTTRRTPARVGGKMPPMGALASGSGRPSKRQAASKVAQKVRTARVNTGRRREYGLRSLELKQDGLDAA